MKHLFRVGPFAVMSLLASAAIVAAEPAAPAYETFTYLFVLFLHQVLLVFWLGPDIGVYMWSTKVVNPELTPGQRLAAGRIMQVIAVLPQVCMSLMLTVGGVLTELRGIEHPWWQMAGIWLLGPVWLTLTLLVYVNARTDKGSRLLQLDTGFRWLVIVSVLLSVLYSVSTGRFDAVPWLMPKLLLFAAVVFFGLRMRQRLEPFIAGLDQLQQAGPSPELDKTFSSSIARARLFMFAAWLALAMAAGLGIVQPGSA